MVVTDEAVLGLKRRIRGCNLWAKKLYISYEKRGWVDRWVDKWVDI